MKVIFKSSNSLKNAFLLKDQILHAINSKVNYKYISNICKGVYIGETKRHLLVHQYKHMGKSVFTNKLLKYNERMLLPLEKTIFIVIMWETYVILT